MQLSFDPILVRTHYQHVAARNSNWQYNDSLLTIQG